MLAARPVFQPNPGFHPPNIAPWCSLDIVYERVHNDNSDDTTGTEQCYSAMSLTEFQTYPIKVILMDIVFKDFWATLSNKSDPVVGSLICCSDMGA